MYDPTSEWRKLSHFLYQNGLIEDPYELFIKYTSSCGSLFFKRKITSQRPSLEEFKGFCTFRSDWRNAKFLKENFSRLDSNGKYILNYHLVNTLDYLCKETGKFPRKFKQVVIINPESTFNAADFICNSFYKHLKKYGLNVQLLKTRKPRTQSEIQRVIDGIIELQVKDNLYQKETDQNIIVRVLCLLERAKINASLVSNFDLHEFLRAHDCPQSWRRYIKYFHIFDLSEIKNINESLFIIADDSRSPQSLTMTSICAILIKNNININQILMYALIHEARQ